MAKTFGPYPGLFKGLHDGDTLWIDIDLGFDHIISSLDFDGKVRLSCRVYGINAPELSTEAGKEAKAFAETLLHPGDRCEVLSWGWDKYGGRWDGSVKLPDGSDFGTRMVDAGMAVRI